ncbi:MAG: hypothetical protein P1V36_00265 [Planctomycetota bacterium]|nr:hypothetical protein [Planctomycetota bacterium]
MSDYTYKVTVPVIMHIHLEVEMDRHALFAAGADDQSDREFEASQSDAVAEAVKAVYTTGSGGLESSRLDRLTSGGLDAVLWDQIDAQEQN